MNNKKDKSYLKIIGLIWILIECNLVAGNIFGFASLFSELPKYKIYQSKCGNVSERIVLNNTKTQEKACVGQIQNYEFDFALGIAFYNLPAIIV
ncbi:unnamed protein product, partial [Rotaria sp. Silwood1]